jgi:hypothetical protein
MDAMELAKRTRGFVTSNNPAVGYFAVFFAATALYVATCAPGPVWQDSGVIQYRVWHNDFEGQLGLALSHPLFYIIASGAKYLPFGEFGYRVNLVTAIISALAAANLYLLLRLWLGKNFPAIVGAVTLALSHTFWRHATIPETYNLYISLLLAELIVLLKYFQTRRIGFLYALGFLNGLAIAGHMLASIGFVCYAAFIVALSAKKRIGVKSICVMMLLWVIGAAPYEYLIVKNLIESGDLSATISSALFGEGYRQHVLNTSLSLRIIKENLSWIMLNFPTPNILLFLVGLFVLRRLAPARAFANILLALLVLFLVFAFRYTIVDRYAFFIPFYCIVSILMGLGAHYVVFVKNRRVLGYLIILSTALPIPSYAVAPQAAKKLGITSGRNREIPYRDDYRYFLQPWRTGYRGAEKFAEDAFRQAQRNAIIYADTTTAPPLLYAQQVKSKRMDLSIISRIGCSENSPEFNEHTFGKLFAERAVYLVSPLPGYCPKFLLDNHNFVKTGVVWRVVERD